MKTMFKKNNPAAAAAKHTALKAGNLMVIFTAFLHLEKLLDRVWGNDIDL